MKNLMLFYKKNRFVFNPMMILLFLSVQINAQSSLFEFQQPNEVKLSPEETKILDQLTQKSKPEGNWMVSVNSLDAVLEGEKLTVEFQDGKPETFTADYYSKEEDGSYYWTGASENGSVINIGKYPTGYLGDIYYAPTASKYVLSSLSSKAAVLIKYPASIFEVKSECGNNKYEDEMAESEVENAGCEGNKIKVLVLYTSAANTAGFDPIAVGASLVAQLNATTMASGLTSGQINFSLAAVKLLPEFVENPNDPESDVNKLSNNTTAIGLRDLHKGDVVILLTKDVYPTINGIAKGINVSNGNAFCLASINSVALGFTGSHEIGHLIGAHHNRCNVCSNCDPSISFAHGYKISSNFKTIMHVLACGGTRVGRWSSKSSKFMGMDTGNLFNDNCKKFKNRASTVSCFRN
jgi:Metallo-peptidase family M12